MGNKFVVKSWVPMPHTAPDFIQHIWKEVYAGESMEEAMVAMCKEKDVEKVGCVVLEWR